MSDSNLIDAENKEPLTSIYADVSQPGMIDKQYPTGWRFALVITSLVCGILLVAIDNTIIAVAVPKISTDFKALDDVGWYGSAYLLTETALQPTLGNFFKYFDVKLLYLISMVIFEGDDRPFYFLDTAVKLTLESHSSRLSSVRRSFFLCLVHFRQSYRRRRCRRYLSRSPLHCWAHSTSRKAGHIPWYCPKLIHPCDLQRSNCRRSSHVKRYLEMVLLDLSFPSHIETAPQALTFP